MIRMTKRVCLVAILTAACAVAVSPLLADGEMKAAAATPAEKSVVIGKSETAKWTETTVKAASAPENKAVLDKGKKTTITGELVDVSCYLQLGKKGEKHVPCGSDCVRNGQPAGILEKNGQLTILMVEEHDPRRYGQIKVTDQLAALLAKTVTATGILTQEKGYRALYVQGSELAAMSPPAVAPSSK